LFPSGSKTRVVHATHVVSCDQVALCRVFHHDVACTLMPAYVKCTSAGRFYHVADHSLLLLPILTAICCIDLLGLSVTVPWVCDHLCINLNPLITRSVCWFP